MRFLREEIDGNLDALVECHSGLAHQQMRLMLILVPGILALIAALKFCSALAVYWTVSNGYSTLQTCTCTM
jgi:membrane protein insertase Oxa1/YidC/SpoIIIJ